LWGVFVERRKTFMKPASKTVLSSLVLLLTWLGFAQSSQCAEKVLAVPLIEQEQDQWSWTGCSAAVLKYYGKAINQCYIADFGWTRDDCCTTPANCNSPNTLYGSSGSIQDILKHWCVSSIGVANALTFEQCRTQIDANRPFIIRYEWDKGGWDFIVVRGYKTDPKNKLYLMNPMKGEGYGIFSYTYVKKKAGDHTWTQTLKGIKRDPHLANWSVENTPPVYYSSGQGYWSYKVSIKEIQDGCGDLHSFYTEFYDPFDGLMGREEYPLAEFRNWYVDCADADTQFPRLTTFCGEVETGLVYQSGYVKHSFVIKCDSGSTITRSVKIHLTGGGGGSQFEIQQGPGIPWARPAK
jgi:hypothetical protein